MHSGRVRKTYGSPDLLRHKSEMIPSGLPKSLSVNSRKYKLLTKEDEEFIAEPMKLDK